jgi:regulator of sigma E protease
MFELAIKIIPTLIALGILIFVHELGHFLACRISRVGVEKFSIGFGPELLTWQGKNTRYSISLIPFGGFVKPQGESYEEIKKRGQAVAGDYVSASIFSRFLILIAGVAMNFIFAYVLFVSVLTLGRPTLSSTIGGFVEGYPAATSDLEVGDQVTHLNGEAVSNWQELTFQILESSDPVLTFTVNRIGQSVNVPVTAQFEDGKDIFGGSRRVPRIGIKHSEEFITEKYDLSVAFVKAAQFEWKLSVLTLEALWRLATGQLSFKAVSGPIGIMSMAGDAAKMGLATFLQFMALLSISLGVINVLPIPALDGGHLFFLLFEIIFRKPVSLSIQERVTQVGFFFLMSLMVFVVYNDLVNVGALEKVKSFSGKTITGFYDGLEKRLTKRLSPVHRES